MAFDIRSPLLAVCLIGGALFSASAAAEKSTPVNPADVQRTAMEDPKVCKRITPTGSRIARRFCFRQSEWEAMRDGGQRAARDAAIEESQFGYRGIGPGGPNRF
ncbi:MAG: hypothetical protein EP301_05130 [Gammaproteobacteria bacterium]|jgi:hypothetical protein|nr:MAG: hypothetical protein EP301_05130 [Gammaproteobacteria bacterium]